MSENDMNQYRVNVVHMEDDQRLNEIFRVALRSAEPNINLIQFGNSNHLIDYFLEHAHEIDLFVLDIRVPGEWDGFEIAKLIRRYPCNSPIILTSAFQRPDLDLLKTMNVSWHPKPWHLMETTRTLAKVARGYREARYRMPGQ